MTEKIERMVFKFWSDERISRCILEEAGVCIKNADKSGILKDVEEKDLLSMQSVLYFLLCENSKKYYNRMGEDTDSSELCIPESYVFYRGADPHEYGTELGSRIGEECLLDDNKLHTIMLLEYLQKLGLLNFCVTTEGHWEDGDSRYRIFLFLNYDNLLGGHEKFLKILREKL